jgi:molybdopterin/thiamine biosynthesis adenylyltransferase
MSESAAAGIATRARARVLVVGVGGLGCPAAMALAESGVKTIGLCDDDVVERSNLHRQILFGDADVGMSKVAAAARALGERVSGIDVRLHECRLLPGSAMDLVRQYDVVVEGSDNFATKFLAADVCALARVPVVHASAVRWIGTVLAVGARGRPCYRCVFEDVPSGETPNCAEAGVMGPVLGVVAAMQVDLALAFVDGQRPIEGELVTFDGRNDSLRRRRIAARTDCPLCGDSARIHRIDAQAYAAVACSSL